jgi:hypothetical protein
LDFVFVSFRFVSFRLRNPTKWNEICKVRKRNPTKRNDEICKVRKQHITKRNEIYKVRKVPPSSGFRSKKLHTLIFKCWIKSYLHVYVITILLNVIKDPLGGLPLYENKTLFLL